jgi:hypothetical protein
MPKDLVDDKTKFPPVVRVPIDGDDANGANFELPYQQLTDRTAFINEETLTQGVRRFRRNGSFAELRAVADMLPNDIRVVLGEGFYRYEVASPDAEELPWTVKPLTGVGVWRHVDAVRRPRIERASFPLNIFAPPLQTSSTTFVDAGLTVKLLGARAGERVVVHFNGEFKATGGSTGGILFVALTDGSGAKSTLNETVFGVTPATPHNRAVSAVWDLGVDGDVTVSVQFRVSTAGSTVQIFGPANLLAYIAR